MHSAIQKTCIAGLVAALAATALAGCEQDKEQHSMMTYQQAADLIEQLISENAAALHPTPRLEPIDSVGKAPCSGPNDDQETGQVMVEHDYWLRDIDQTLNEDMFQQLRRYWSDHGYRITRENGNSSEFRKVVAQHPENEFKVTLTEGHGVLSIGSQSSCVPRPAEDLPK
jgi:hypothetical protein